MTRLLLALLFCFASPSFSRAQEADDVPANEQRAPKRLHRPRLRFDGGRNEPRVVLFSNFLLRTNETARDVVVIGGDARIDGQIEGNLTVVGGSLVLNGAVGQQVVVVGGAVTMGPESAVQRHAVFIGGPFKINPKADLARDRVEIEVGSLSAIMGWARDWVAKGLLWGRLLVPDLTWQWFVVAGFFIFYAFLVVIFPRAVASVVDTLERRPIASMCAGLIGFILSAPLTFLLVISIVGILVVPFLKIGMLLLILFGKAGLLCYIGKNVTGGGRLEGLRNPMLSLVVGALLLTIAYMVPVLGLMAFFTATLIGFGAAIIALFASSKRNETTGAPPVAVQVRPSALATGVAPMTESSIVMNTPGEATRPAASVPPVQTALTSTPPVQQPDVVLMQRAGFWKRLVAALLDLILICWLIPLVHVFFIPLALIYFIGMWTWRGTTIGSIVMGLKIVRLDGKPINFAVALVRSLSSIFSAIVLFLGFLWAGWDREKQSWHDKIAGTVVVRMPKGVALI